MRRLCLLLLAAAMAGCATTAPPPPLPSGPPEVIDRPVPVPPVRLPRPPAPAWRTAAACADRQPADWSPCLNAMGQDLREAWMLIGRLYAIIDTNNAAVERMIDKDSGVAPR